MINATATQRTDAEYFQRVHLSDAATVVAYKKRFYLLSDLGIAVDASAFYPSIEDSYGQGDLPFLRVGDVSGFVDLDNCEVIPSELCDEHATLARVSAGDILFTKGGAIDRVGFVTGGAAVSRDLIFLNTSTLSDHQSKLLFTYFSSSFFRRMLVRSSSQTAQPHLTITLVRELPVLKASERLQQAVAKRVTGALDAKVTQKRSLIEAGAALLASLGLGHWSLPQPVAYRSTSSLALRAGRIDAEFFAPRIRDLIGRLGGSGIKIGDVAPARREKFDASLAGSFDYIEISDLNGDGTATSTSLDRADAPSRATARGRVRQRGGKSGVAEVALGHAATVAI